uniref:bile salt sulfotransferase-like n=1 Tax=Urocitellus parryii TaxID=9999 RepID=UPI000E55CA3E
TQWLIEILCLIHSRGDPKWVQSVPFWKRSPWIERRDAEQLDRDSEGPRCFTSHLPFHLFPKSFFTSKGKPLRKVDIEGVVTLVRRGTPGRLPCGSWCEHIHGWMSVSHRENVLLLSYEDLQKVSPIIASACLRPNIFAPPDIPGPQFLPSKFPVNAEPLRGHKEAFLEGSVCSTEISAGCVQHVWLGTFLHLFPPKVYRGKEFTGSCGDWENHFTVAQAVAFGKLHQEKMKGLPGGLSPWE